MGVVVRQKIEGKGKPWWVFISHNGARTSRQVGDKRAAEAAASKIRAKLQLGEFNLDEKKERPIPFFKHCTQAWIEITVPATCKESTSSDYKTILDNHVLPFLGDLKVNEITEGKIKEFLFNKVNAGYAGSTVSHMKNVISGILNQAIDDNLIPANPALNLGTKFMKKINDAIKARKASNGDENKGDPDPLSQKELKLLLDKVQEHFSEYYPLFLLLARTGVRIGEALGLRWGDIDFNSRFINLKRSLSRGKITTLKSKRSRRIDMSKQLSHVLKMHRSECKKKGFALGLGDCPEYVFTNTLGDFVDVNNWRRRVFNKALEKAELRKVRIHDLRHTYATLRISKGDNIADVSNQLGHYSVKFTMDIYFHWVPGKKKSEVDELDDLNYLHSNAPSLHPVPSENKKEAANVG
jgi:integrase